VAIETFCAVVIVASSWLTRCEIGALDPTQGQAPGAALAGTAEPATTNSDDAAAAVARAASFGPVRGAETPKTRMMPPGAARFLHNIN
jgi:hypothetical protein